MGGKRTLWWLSSRVRTIDPVLQLLYLMPKLPNFLMQLVLILGRLIGRVPRLPQLGKDFGDLDVRTNTFGGCYFTGVAYFSVRPDCKRHAAHVRLFFRL